MTEGAAPRSALEPPAEVAGTGFGDDERAERFSAFLHAHSGERHIAVLQDYPDPDAISSAIGYRELARCCDVDVDIVYEGRISHQENLALVHLLELELTRWTEGLVLDRYDGAVFLDNQGTTSRLTERLAAAGVPTLAIIDHHAAQELLDPEFSDIREVGAAATIIVDYMRASRILNLSVGNEAHARLATALMHGLRSETKGFIDGGSPELLAAAWLSPYVDTGLLEEILQVQRSRGTMDVIKLALTDRKVRGGFSFAGVGYLRHADRDAVPQATDFLATEENVHTAIVYGILRGEGEREVVVGSMRTSKVTVDVDSFLKSALGTDFRGRYYGGGRSGAGGFEIPVGFLEGATDAEQLKLKWVAFNRQIREKLMRAAGLEEEAEEGEE
ncbi:MAG TPA: DHH family phosphoesterase [Longimicrobiales bacterium]|nr:DHH family phosphoesterase [Longimicrobiales bacterium]